MAERESARDQGEQQGRGEHPGEPFRTGPVAGQSRARTRSSRCHERLKAIYRDYGFTEVGRKGLPGFSAALMEFPLPRPADHLVGTGLCLGEDPRSTGFRCRSVPATIQGPP